jgi:groucho
MSPLPNQHHNGTASPRENGMMMKKLIDHTERDRDRGSVGGGVGPNSPRSGTSSNASTPSNKKMEDKPSTPIAKSVTPGPNNAGGPGGPSNGISGGGGAGGGGGLVKTVAKPPVLNPGYPPYLGPLNGGNPHDLQAAAAYAAAGVHLPPGLNNYPRPPLQVGFDPHAQMRAPPLGPAAPGAIPGGKP